jgi:hypothetical protein
VELQVQDPAGQYLPRRATIDLPRDPDPANAAQSNSLFRAVDVSLFPTPAAPTWPGWAVVRASVTSPTPGVGLADALVRVVRQSDDVRLGAGMTDARGEALVAVQGIPSTTFDEGEGPVLATEVAVRLEVIHDPDAPEVPDPDDLEARRADLRVRTATAMLASGRVVAMDV